MSSRPESPSRTIVLGGLALLSRHWVVFLQALAVPIVLTLIVNATMALLVEPTSGLVLALAIISLLLQTILAVTTHRLVILGPDAAPPWGLSRWSRRESLFLAYLLLFGFTAVFGALSMAAIHSAAALVFGVLAIWVWSRISLIFPAIAIDDRTDLPTVWKLSQNRQSTMLVCAVAFPFLLSAIASLFAALGTLVATIVATVTQPIFTVLTVTILSKAYEYFRPAPPRVLN